MTTAEAPTTDDLLERARSVADQLAAHAGRHDADGSYVVEGLDALRAAGLLTIGVPVELGGAGATPRQIAMVQRELAHHCGSTALG
ncbi:MAG TPA: acyl-CoA dehydrogenase family protein, partial [Acidimicrobiales bacterium]|nr:acyl-CoA dehydrogenase family protein [Acidimicrobiales bacterium]